MSQRITRSVTASRRRARLHLLALPAEVRSLIIKELCSSAVCLLEYNYAPAYSGVCLQLLRTCRVLRSETIFILGLSMRFELCSTPHCMPCIQRWLLPGIWDHLREITYTDEPPALSHLEDLKQVKSLEHVFWKPCGSGPLCWLLNEYLWVPTKFNHQRWNVDLHSWVTTVPEEHCYDRGCGDRIPSTYYQCLDLPFKLQLHLHMHAEVEHPTSSKFGYLDLVSQGKMFSSTC